MNAPRDAVKQEFARRILNAIAALGWNQSELARQATKYLPTGKQFKRDAVSTYMRGKCLPSPAHLHALAQALNVKPEDLLPNRNISNASDDHSSPFYIRQMLDGRVWVRINQPVDWDSAVEIMKLLGKSGHKIAPLV